jgi:hypothetical protein
VIFLARRGNSQYDNKKKLRSGIIEGNTKLFVNAQADCRSFLGSRLLAEIHQGGGQTITLVARRQPPNSYAILDDAARSAFASMEIIESE